MDSEYALMMEPNDYLTFKFTPGTNISTTIYLRNGSDLNIAYKVKTTAPKAYLVRPSQGILSPGEQKEISVAMHASDSHPGAPNHKFLVQHSITDLTPSSEISEFSKFWDIAVKDGKLNSARLSVKILEDSDLEVTPVLPPPKIDAPVQETLNLETNESENENGKKDMRIYYVAGVALIFFITLVAYMINS